MSNETFKELDELRREFDKWQKLSREVSTLMDEGIAKLARKYHKSQAKEFDDKALEKLRRVANKLDVHIKNHTKATEAEMSEWASLLWDPKKS